MITVRFCNEPTKFGHNLINKVPQKVVLSKKKSRKATYSTDHIFLGVENHFLRDTADFWHPNWP